MRLRWLAPLAICAIAATPAVASDARALFDEGVTLANEGAWNEALEKFEASYTLVERPSTLFNIGSVLIKLGRHDEAIERLERFLGVSKDDKERASAQALIDEAKQAAAQSEAPPPEPPPPEPPPPEPPPPAVEPPPPRPPPPPPADLVTAPVAKSDRLVERPWFWITVGVVVVGAAVAVGLAASGGAEPPYGGTGNRVLEL